MVKILIDAASPEALANLALVCLLPPPRQEMASLILEGRDVIPMCDYISLLGKIQ